MRGLGDGVPWWPLAPDHSGRDPWGPGLRRKPQERPLGSCRGGRRWPLVGPQSPIRMHASAHQSPGSRGSLGVVQVVPKANGS